LWVVMVWKRWFAKGSSRPLGLSSPHS
jgi:hypothetical protein